MEASKTALALVHEGWEHLRLQRPLAAWSSWQQALRLKPDDPAALEALAILESADELPISARLAYRFRSPETPEGRERWSDEFAVRDLRDLDSAADVFSTLLDDDPDDASAALNLGLCWAWEGRNSLAIEALERSVSLEASTNPAEAITSWMLAEILRQGAGAEAEADDLSYSFTLQWKTELGDPFDRFAGLAKLSLVPVPLNPATGEPASKDIAIAEWLDQSFPGVRGSLPSPRVLASLIASDGLVKVSSPDLVSLTTVEAVLEASLGDQFQILDRSSIPLPLRIMDVAAWLFRIPDTDDSGEESAIRRSSIESYYEQIWIHRPRIGLANSLTDKPATPLEASQGNDGSKAKLAAVINIREQLAARPIMREIVDGYPFDRLRRRLGLPMNDESTVDPSDVSCMSREELDRLDLVNLSPDVLSEARNAAFSICDPATIDRLEAEIRRRNHDSQENVP
jgi:tetratricopeptide (TPR) repeat protein